MRFSVPVNWKMTGIIEIDAMDIEEAIKKAKNTHPSYLDKELTNYVKDSMEVDTIEMTQTNLDELHEYVERHAHLRGLSVQAATEEVRYIFDEKLSASDKRRKAFEAIQKEANISKITPAQIVRCLQDTLDLNGHLAKPNLVADAEAETYDAIVKYAVDAGRSEAECLNHINGFIDRSRQFDVCTRQAYQLEVRKI